MERGRWTPKDLDDKTVVDADGERIGVVDRVAYDPETGVGHLDVRVDEDTRTTEIGPYVELIPDEVAHVGAGELVVSSTLGEIAHRLEVPGFAFTLDLDDEDASIEVDLLEEPEDGT